MVKEFGRKDLEEATNMRENGSMTKSKVMEYSQELKGIFIRGITSMT